MVHGDGNTRQCMATAATAYKESFGFDAPPYTYRDFEQSDVIVLVGSNLCIAHPILWERVCRNPHRPEIVVIDPRATETARAATRHYASAADRADVAPILGIPVERIPDRGGWAYDQIVEGIRSGAIRGLWIAGTNGAHSWIDQSDFRALLAKLDFLCLHDLSAATET